MVVSYSGTVFTVASSYVNTITITNDILSIPIFTDTGDGEINTAIIRLSAIDDKYITSTALNDNDRVYLVVAETGGGSYARTFEIMSKVNIKNKSEPPTLQLELAGIEIHLQRVKVSMNTFTKSTRELFTALMDCYAQSKTTLMPTITYNITDIPDIMSNLDWSTEDTVLNRLNELVDSFGASGVNNGVLDFFDILFTSSVSVNNIVLSIFSSGNTVNNTNVITNPISFEGKLEPSKVSLVGAWGASDAGSLPKAWSKFAGKQLIMTSNKGSDSVFPQWVSGLNYPINSKVRHITSTIDKVYKKLNSSASYLTTAPNLSADWIEFTTSDFYGTLFQYSPWTNNKISAWKNGGTGNVSSPFSGITNNSQGICFFDGNLIINDSSSEAPAFRTWVDVAQTSSTLPTELLYGGTQAGKYKGLRVLVKGTGSGDFTGKFNNIMEYNGTQWVEKYDHEDGMIVVNFSDGKTYKYDSTQSLNNRWVDYSGIANALDCLHPFTNFYSDTSCILNPDDTSILPADRQYPTSNNNSALTVQYDWNAAKAWTDALISTALGESTSAQTLNMRRNFYASGAWLSFRFPFPVTTYNGGEVVGQLYGGTADRKVPSLDLGNSTYTTTGKVGYNHDDSEDLGAISSVDFYMKIDYSYVVPAGSKYRGKTPSSTIFLEGNFPMRMFLFDGSDHVVVQDFVINFNRTWQDISLPISGFSLYRGRRAKSINALANVIPPKDLEYIDVFDAYDVKLMCICTKDSYDEHGRYSPATNMWQGGINPLLPQTIKLSIDGLRFTKPLLALSSPVSAASTDPVKQEVFLQRPNIFVYDQLEGDVYNELQKLSFKYEEYNITTKGDFLTPYGSFFFFDDSSILHNDSGSHKVKLVAKHVEYSITKPINNIGGLIRKIRGIRRFV